MIGTIALHVMALALGGEQRDTIAYLALTDQTWQVWVMSDDGSEPHQITRTPGDKARASWYPDGTRLFVNGTDGKAYRVEVATGKETVVPTNVVGFQDAVLSPDARSFAYSLNTSGGVDMHDMWVAQEDGSNPRKLTTMSWLQHEPAWSVDGHYVYFLSGSGDQTHDIWRVGVADRRTEQLTSNQLYHFDVAAGPDGRLAFSSNRSGNYDIWVRSTAGEDRQITNDAALDGHPAWSPDGKSLVFDSSSGGMGIWRIHLESGARNRLTPSETPSRFPVWRVTGNTP